MRYAKIEDLPDGVRNSLPEHALETYRAAFNRAWEQHAEPDDGRGDAGREETAHRVAWNAVKQVDEKDADARWQELD